MAGSVDDERVGMQHVVEPEDDFDEDDLADEEFDDTELEDATDEDIDFVLALYREDGVAVISPLDADLANDLEELINQLNRLPGDAGAIGMVSLAGEVLVVVRARGPRHVQVLTTDVYYADQYPIVRDVVDFHSSDEELPEDGPAGDLDLFASQGISEMQLEAMCLEEEDLDSVELAERLARGIHFDAAQFGKVVDDYWDDQDDD